MFFPFEELRDKELFQEAFPQKAKMDLEPIQMQFEVYVRLVLGIAYDRCRQLWEEFPADKDRDILDRALKIDDPSVKRSLSGWIYQLCVSKYSDGLASWFKENNQSSEITQLLPDDRYKEGDVKPILKNSKYTTTLGEYQWNLLLMIDTIQKICPDDETLDYLQRAVIPITIYIEMRNRNGHNLTTGHISTMKKIRKWLQEQGDPLFSKDFKNSCEVVMPVEWDNRGEVQCVIWRGKVMDKGMINADVLHRKNLAVESVKYTDEFQNTLYIRMTIKRTGKIQYFRISPFINIKENEEIFMDVHFGMLLRNTIGGEFLYRKIQVTNYEGNQNMISGEYLSEEEIIYFEQKYCFSVNSAKEIISSRMKLIGDGTKLFISRHPEFQSVIDLSRQFTYYSVIDAEGNSRIGQLQKKRSGVCFIFLIGHGGLGKTHLVLHLLRTRYHASYTVKGDEIRFNQVMFLSAKRNSMQISTGTIEMNLDHDIKDYESMISLLGEQLLTEKTKNSCKGSLKQLENELIKTGSKQLIIIDDLDTMEFEEQKKVCRFFERYKNENHRVLITSRVVPVAISSLVSNQTTVPLQPLNEERSLEFYRHYINGKKRNMEDISAQEIKKIYKITKGIPLNLVLVIHLKMQGYDEESLYSQAKITMEESTRFIFQHVLNALEEQTRRTFSMMRRLCKMSNSQNNMGVIGYDILRLLVPSLSKDEYEAAIGELEYYSIIEKADNDNIYLRYPEILNDTDEMALNLDSQSILEYVQKDPKKWQIAIGSKQTLLDWMLPVAKDWEHSGDSVKQKWAASCAQIALSPKYVEFIISEYVRIEWKRLKMGPEIDIIDELKQQIDNLEQLNPETEKSIKLLTDRYYIVLQTLDRCHYRWPKNKDQIDHAFATCADVMMGIYKNENPDVDGQMEEIEERLKKSYCDFRNDVDQCISERCEDILRDSGVL